MEALAHAMLFWILVYAQVMGACIVTVIFIAVVSAREEKQTHRQENQCKKRKSSR